MEIFLDEHRTECTFSADASLAELVSEIKSKLGALGRILVGIECDGIDITGDGFAATMRTPLAGHARIDLRSADPKVLISDAMATARKLLDATEESASEIVSLLSQGDIAKALHKLGECCNGWLQVHQGVCNSIAMLGIDPAAMTVDGESLSAILAVPCQQLQEIKNVVIANDYVLLSDILTYEFSKSVQCWRTILDALSSTNVAVSTGCH